MMLGLLFLTRQMLPPEVPFNYLAPWGEAQLATSVYLWCLPALGTFILVVNLVLGYTFRPRELLLTKLLVLTAVVINLMLTVGLLRILSLVFRWRVWGLTSMLY